MPKQRTNWHLILGPPGTGKTFTLLAHIEGALGDGCAPDAIAFMSFTKAACREAKERAMRKFKLDREALIWFRTIHSAAFKLIGASMDDMMRKDDWAQFCERYGYDLSDNRGSLEDDMETVLRTDDDELMAAMNWGRSRMLDLDRTAAQAPFDIPVPRFMLFAERYNGFREETHKLDFYDQLEGALRMDARPHVEIAYVDESQDLSPLQVALVEKWFGPCRRVVVAGDDDQAIYGFQGGTPDWLLLLERECERVQVLEQSYRIPARVHRLAEGIIGQNRKRVTKSYRPRADAGDLEVMELDGALRDIDTRKKTLVLARNWAFLKEAANALADLGIAFDGGARKGWSPLGHPTVVDAYRAARKIQQRKPVDAVELRALFKQIPSKTKDTPGLARGLKKRARENKGPVTVDGLIKDWGLRDLVEVIDRDGAGAPLVKAKPEICKRIERIIDRYGFIPDRPLIRISSIHGAKGREADVVILLSDMSRATYDAFVFGETEAERRVAYVGVTRARERLIVVRPWTERFFPYAEMVRETLAIENILAGAERYEPEVEGHVVDLWLSCASEDAIFGYRKVVGKLRSKGLQPVDARWASYMQHKGL